jgi:hypothetical protein
MTTAPEIARQPRRLLAVSRVAGLVAIEAACVVALHLRHPTAGTPPAPPAASRCSTRRRACDQALPELLPTALPARRQPRAHRPGDHL